MQIHVVKQGDSLYKLSQVYGVSASSISSINGIAQNEPLIIGQTLLIPTKNQYTVKAGDTLWSISQKFDVSYKALQKANPTLNVQSLQPGTVIKLPERKKDKITVNGYLEPHQGLNPRFQEAAPALTYLAIFSYHVDAKGDLTPPEQTGLLEAVQATNVGPLMTITNIKGAQFDKDVGTAVLTNQNIQEHLISEVLSILKDKKYAGLNIDFEFLGKELREDYNQFLRKVTKALHDAGFIVCTSLAPKTSGTQSGAWYESHDYPAQGKIVDFVILMTYEWGWSGGPPMPVSPITQVKRVVNYALSVMPANKIVMSIPLYGYDWTLPYEQGGKFAKALNPIQAVQLARKHNVSIQYDEKEEAPSFKYTDNQGRSHIVWFEDLRTMDAMFEFVKEKNLRGISFWNLAFRYPPIWPMLQDYFDIRKD